MRRIFYIFYPGYLFVILYLGKRYHVYSVFNILSSAIYFADFIFCLFSNLPSKVREGYSIRIPRLVHRIQIIQILLLEHLPVSSISPEGLL